MKTLQQVESRSVLANDSAALLPLVSAAAGDERGQVVVNPGMGFVNFDAWSDFAY